MKYKIVSSLCTDCGQCASICPSNAINRDVSGKYYINPAECTGCGVCKSICPEEAIIEVE